MQARRMSRPSCRWPPQSYTLIPYGGDRPGNHNVSKFASAGYKSQLCTTIPHHQYTVYCRGTNSHCDIRCLQQPSSNPCIKWTGFQPQQLQD
jgi:hypothetical protein